MPHDTTITGSVLNRDPRTHDVLAVAVRFVGWGGGIIRFGSVCVKGWVRGSVPAVRFGWVPRLDAHSGLPGCSLQAVLHTAMATSLSMLSEACHSLNRFDAQPSNSRRPLP